MKHLEKVLVELGFPKDDRVLQKFQEYRENVLKWNEAVNLTAITDPVEFEIKHFVDSIVICSDERVKNAENIIDVGTGAGFPGVPLAILYPHKKFTLMDSLGKRMKIVETLCREIGLNNVEVLHARAEELARKKEYRESYDLCVSRAVANLSTLSEYCLPFVKVGGWFAPYKTAAAEEEIINGKKAVKMLGGEIVSRLTFQESQSFEQDGEKMEHLILWIEKKKNTLAKYPRKPGTPAKEPLK